MLTRVPLRKMDWYSNFAIEKCLYPCDISVEIEMHMDLYRFGLFARDVYRFSMLFEVVSPRYL